MRRGKGKHGKHTLAAGEQFLVFCASIQHALQLKLTELSLVHNVFPQAVKERI